MGRNLIFAAALAFMVSGMRGPAPVAAPAEDSPTTPTAPVIVFLGEKPRVQVGGRAPQLVALDPIASQTLPGVRSLDLTVEKESVAATARRADKALAAHPAAVVIFTGSSEQASGGDDERLRGELVQLARIFTRRDINVFFVPSSTAVGADVAANLRLAADDAAAQYIEPGTVIGGDAYETVLREIGKLVGSRLSPPRATPKAVAVTVSTPMPASAAAPTTTTSPATVVMRPATTPATIYMVPPPPLKHFDPRETPTARKRLGKLKQPAFEP